MLSVCSNACCSMSADPAVVHRGRAVTESSAADLPMCFCVCIPPQSDSPVENTIRKNKLIILLSVLFVIVCAIVVVIVSNILDVGSVPFFVVVVLGALVFMCFLSALVALVKSSLAPSHTGDFSANRQLDYADHPNMVGLSDSRDSANLSPSVPVFYYLQTIHRPTDNADQDPVDDAEYWVKGDEVWMAAYCEKFLIRNISAKSARSVKSETSKGEVCAICLCDMDPSQTAVTGVSNCCKRAIHIRCAQKYFNVVRRVQCPLCRHVVVSPNTSTQASSPPPGPPV